MKHLEPIMASVLFALLLLAGILALESSKDVFGPSAGAAVAVAALSAYFVVYDMMKRDAISARRGASDKSAALSDVTPRIPLQDLEIIDAVTNERSPGASMLAATAGLDKTTAIAFRISFPAPGAARNDLYDAEHLLDQMKILQESFKDHFRYVYFVRHNKQFVGYAERAAFFGLLTQRETSRPLIIALNAGRDPEFAQEKGIESTAIDATWSNGKALQYLATRQRTSAMIVKASSQRAIGVIDWATLVNRVLGSKA